MTAHCCIHEPVATTRIQATICPNCGITIVFSADESILRTVEAEAAHHCKMQATAAPSERTKVA